MKTVRSLSIPPQYGHFFSGNAESTGGANFTPRLALMAAPAKTSAWISLEAVADEISK
jgi:hypothetical protein